MTEKYRLQKFLSRAGVTSRRKAEKLIDQGRVKVNGTVVTEQGTSVTPGRTRVEVDGKPVFWTPERVYILLNKPTNYITTLDDPHDRPIVIDLLPKKLPRVVPVGRLDWDSEGLLLLTNDGDLAHAMMHPSTKVPRTYAVKVKGELTESDPPYLKLKEGLELEDGFIKPDKLKTTGFTGKHTWLEMELHSGRNRIIRRMCDAIGHTVLKLQRVAFGPLTLDGLQPGDYRDLTEDEVRTLYKEAELDASNLHVRSKKGVSKGMKGKQRRRRSRNQQKRGRGRNNRGRRSSGRGRGRGKKK